MFAFDPIDRYLPNFSRSTQTAVLPGDQGNFVDVQKDARYLPSNMMKSATSRASGMDYQPREPITEVLKAKAAKKHKKSGIQQGAPATHVVRGFETPVMSGGEESDFSATSTPRLECRTPPSTIGSPNVRPSSLTRAISALRLDLSPPDGSPTRSRPVGTNGFINQQYNHDNVREVLIGSLHNRNMDHTDTYDIPVRRDFACSDACPKPLFDAADREYRHDSPHRKMTSSDFEPIKCLGKGTYGTVLLVRQHSTGRLFAQKQLKKATITVHKQLVEQTRNERTILESVKRHPFVVKLYYAFQDQEKLYLILEYAQGGELFHHLAIERSFNEETSAFYMAELVLALEHLHHNLGVVYRDLKPENCLLDAEGHLLLTDFGLSKVPVEDSSLEVEKKLRSIVGTTDYMAPEVIQGKPYDAAVDWWSLGALGYDLLTGAPPFAANNDAKIRHKIVHGKVTMPYYLSPDAKDILTRLLRKEPRKRLGASMPKDLVTIKGHRFFRRVDWKLLQKRQLTAPIQPIITNPADAENFSKDFTDLAVSPVEERLSSRAGIDMIHCAGIADLTRSPVENVFTGFSFVASSSLLESTKSFGL